MIKTTDVCLVCGGTLSGPYPIRTDHPKYSRTPLWRKRCVTCNAVHMSPYKNKEYVLAPDAEQPKRS